MLRGANPALATHAAGFTDQVQHNSVPCAEHDNAAGPVTLKKAQQEESAQHASCVIGWWFAHLAEERRLFPFQDSASS